MIFTNSVPCFLRGCRPRDQNNRDDELCRRRSGQGVGLDGRDDELCRRRSGQGVGLDGRDGGLATEGDDELCRRRSGQGSVRMGGRRRERG